MNPRRHGGSSESEGPMSLPGVLPSATRLSNSRRNARIYITLGDSFALPSRVSSVWSCVSVLKNSNGCATAGLFLIGARKRHTSDISEVQTLRVGGGGNAQLTIRSR